MFTTDKLHSTLRDVLRGLQPTTVNASLRVITHQRLSAAAFSGYSVGQKRISTVAGLELINQLTATLFVREFSHWSSIWADYKDGIGL